MENCKLSSLRGYSYKLPNSIINCSHIQPSTILMPVSNAVQMFDCQKASIIYSGKRQISAIDMQRSLVCIGQMASPGQLISAILLDINNLDSPKIFNYQKTRIDFITLSLDGQFMCSVGNSSGDRRQLNLIEVNNQSEIGTKIFFSKNIPAKYGRVKAVKFSNFDPYLFIVVCSNNITFYRINMETQSVEEVIAKTSRVRQFNNFIFGPDGKSIYGCSQNGDIAQISIQQCRQIRIGPRKRVITKGITGIRFVYPGHLVISGNQGLLALIQIQTMKLVKQIRLEGQQVVSFSEFNGHEAFIATNKAVIYRFDAKTCDTEVIYACHSTKINDIAMIKDYEGVFGTCSGGQIVVWNTQSLKPIIKIYLPKVTCLTICFPKTGRLILSGWSDDAIRIFSPHNGKLIYKIPIANLGKPKVIISDQDSTKMIIGGQNGVIRLWNILQNKMFGLALGSLAFHMKPVNGLAISNFNEHSMVSCGEDGQIAVWNIQRFQLINNFIICNFLKGVSFYSSNRIRAWGSNNVVFECLISDGSLVNTITVYGSFINTLVQCIIETTQQKLMFSGGDEHYLDYFDISYSQIKIHRQPSFGQINKMVLTYDQKHIVVGTQNGLVILYDIFAVKDLKEDYL